MKPGSKYYPLFEYLQGCDREVLTLTVTFKTFQAIYQIQRKDGEITWNADSIKALRIYKGLNQEQFASELGVRRETVSEWENSKYEPDLPGH